MSAARNVRPAAGQSATAAGRPRRRCSCHPGDVANSRPHSPSGGAKAGVERLQVDLRQADAVRTARLGFNGAGLAQHGISDKHWARRRWILRGPATGGSATTPPPGVDRLRVYVHEGVRGDEARVHAAGWPAKGGRW